MQQDSQHAMVTQTNDVHGNGRRYKETATAQQFLDLRPFPSQNGHAAGLWQG
jgi:hypothetical protein